MADSSHYSAERDMAGKAITFSYKGILRISNNVNLINNVADKFLEKTYYFDNNSEAWTGTGENITHDFLTGDFDKKRYISSDVYTTLKLPVTDSMGNFMNFSLGSDGMLIGTYPDAGLVKDGTSFNASTSISVLSSSNPLYIGLSERNRKDSKKIIGGSLSIDNSNTNSAKIVISNKYIHNSADGTLDSVVLNSENKEIRTIFQSADLVKKDDVFYFDQEDAIHGETAIDCPIKLKSIRELVRNKIQEYLDQNISPVPTGTIISQYCNLDKWFCYVDGNFDDYRNWQGYRPSMSKIGSTYSYWNKLNTGNALCTDTFLYYNGNSDGYLTAEMPPDFKRGYLLCDGSSIEMVLTPSFILGKEKQQESFKRFFDLFYNIGYYYQPGHEYYTSESDSWPAVFEAVPRPNKTGYYKFNGLAARRVDTNTLLEVNYGITMATCLIFKKLEELLQGPFTYSTPDEVLNWLKDQKIDDKYIFNVIIPAKLANSAKNEYYLYNNDSLASVTVPINVGREINSFSSKIPYYVLENNALVLKLVPIYKIAEAYHLADMYVNRTIINAADSGIKDDTFRYRFFLPRLWTKTDTTVKYARECENSADFHVGQFVGSNGLLLADTITNIKTGVTVNLTESAQQTETISFASSGFAPHVHALGLGKLSIDYGVSGGAYKTSIDSSSKVTNFSKVTIGGKANNELSAEPANTEILATDHFEGPGYWDDKVNLISSKMNNYVLQEVREATLGEVANSFSGTLGEEYYNEKYIWYGRTSEPIWYTNDITSQTEKFETGTHIGYFRPESVKALPLIKL